MSNNAQRFHVAPAPDSYKVRRENRAQQVKNMQVRTLRKLRDSAKRCAAPIL